GCAGASVDADELPLLVAAAPVAVLHHTGAVVGRRVLDLDRLAAVAVDQPHVTAVGVGQPELLIGAVTVDPLMDSSTVGCRPTGHVDHLARMPRLHPVVAAAGIHELEHADPAGEQPHGHHHRDADGHDR